jgi:hypothetical protein
MGWVETRIDRNGKPRYIAKYRDLRGRKQSAGTFTRRREADAAWQKAEVKIAEGHLGDPRRGRQTFRTYVEEKWLPHHVIEPTTREKYSCYLDAHIMPEFGRRAGRAFALGWWGLGQWPHSVRRCATGSRRGSLRGAQLSAWLWRTLA